jgi:L-lactate dehydrogenase complex protein LldF
MSGVAYSEQEHADFPGASLQALSEPELQRALGKLRETLAAKNRAAWQELPGSDELRERARRIKEEALSRLDHYLRELERSLERVGARVHWAQNAEEARRIVLQIARDRNVRTVVKAKSMTCEEIHLNESLEAAGIEVIETDFGEYIAQAARQRPSHIVLPVIHMTVEQVAEVLSRRLGQRLPADPRQLADAARAALREHFRTADMGITGANFIVAESGTLCLITNEGNGRMVTTVPPVHVAVVGIDKVVPRLSDLQVLLKLLGRAATGQKLSVYTSLLTGPRRDGELDGPDELHVVLLDNGRSRILGSPYRESLFCIRCGACLNTCPVYRKVGGHSYGRVYPGPIGSVLTPLRDGLESYYPLAFASSLCGACQTACPMKIPLPEMLRELRCDMHERVGKGWLASLGYWLWKASLKYPSLYRFSTRMAARLLGRDRDGWLSALPSLLGGWTQARDFPTPARRTFHELWTRSLQYEREQLPDHAAEPTDA